MRLDRLVLVTLCLSASCSNSTTGDQSDMTVKIGGADMATGLGMDMSATVDLLIADDLSLADLATTPDFSLPNVIRPLRPLSGAMTTSLRPILSWSLGTSDDGARVDICSSRGYGTIEQTFDVTGTSGAPSSNLSPGIHYWRLHGKNGGTISNVITPVWEFFVNAHSAAVNTSWGTTSDFNGDGYSDLVVAATGAGTAYVYPGSSTGIANGAAAATALASPDGNGISFARFLATGDFDGDGYADLVASAASYNSALGRLYYYAGSSTGIATTPTSTLDGTDTPGNFGVSVVNAGDLNGDGYPDLAVGASAANTGTGPVFIYLGGASGLTTNQAPHATLTGPDGQNGVFGRVLTSAGDVNGDGFADLIVGAQNVGANNGKVYL